jgi:hypothetical protein
MVAGFSNILFGGQGLFLATLTGPGKVWLQSMPILNLAEEIAKYLPKPSGEGQAVGGGVAGGLAGGLFNALTKG